MKTILIVLVILASTALGLFGYQAGTFKGVTDKVATYVPKDIAREYSPRYIVVGLDITAGREEELGKDRDAISSIIKSARLGDSIEVFLIHSRAESEQEAVFAVEMPTQPGPMEQGIKRAKLAAEKDWECSWNKRIVPLLADTSRKQQTDLFGFMRYVTTQKPEFGAEKHSTLVLFTDGQQVGDGYNLEKRVPATEELKQICEKGLIPSLKGIDVRFAGVTPTHKVTNAHWRKLQDFWKEYAREAGAEKVAVTSDRNIRLE